MMGWTLSYQFNLQAKAANTPLKVKMARVGELDFPQGKVEGSGGTYLLDHAQNASFTAMNRILKAKGKIRWAKKPFTCNGQNYAEGTILASGCSRDFMEKLASSLKLNIQAVSSAPAVDTYEITNPRTGLYQSGWQSKMKAGQDIFSMNRNLATGFCMTPK